MTNEHFNGGGFGKSIDPEDVAAHGVRQDDAESAMDPDDVMPEDLTAPDDAKPDLGTNLGDLGDPGHTFDQTNGLVDGLEGNTDGFADTGDTDAADRDAAGGEDIDGVGPLVPPEH
jgi:hypothetical protein